MIGKRHHTAVTLLLLTITVALFSATTFALGPQPPPAVYLSFTPKSWAVGPECPATYTVEIMSQENFKGSVNLTIIAPLKGINATFNPNPVDVPANHAGISYLTVNVSPKAPAGIHTLYFNITALPGSNYDQSSGLGVNGQPYFTINVGPCSQYASTNTTTTTTYFTSTIVTDELPPQLLFQPTPQRSFGSTGFSITAS